MRISNYDEYELEHLCNLLNDIIEQAIEHGGDSGGPYFVNQGGIENAIKRFLNWTGLIEKLDIYSLEIPQLLVKNKIGFTDDKILNVENDKE